MLVVLVGCSSITDCPTSACADGVNVQAPAEITDLSGGLLTVCVGESCRASEFAGGDYNTIAVVEFEQAQAGEMATAVLEMPDGTSYSAEGVLERLDPNGEDCDGPVCAVAALTLTGS